jgi:hypothetical protein
VELACSGSQRKLWNWLRAAAPEITLIAPDLRGRADSYQVQGTSSMARHVADLNALLDVLGQSGCTSWECRWAASEKKQAGLITFARTHPRLFDLIGCFNETARKS